MVNLQLNDLFSRSYNSFSETIELHKYRPDQKIISYPMVLPLYINIFRNRIKPVTKIITKHKKELLYKGRTIDDITEDVAARYSNLKNVLDIERRYINKFKFTKKQLFHIYIDPINIIYNIACHKKSARIINDNYTLLESILMKYDPDAYYIGQSFSELVTNIIRILVKNNKNVNRYLKLYNNGIAGYGVLKVLYTHNKLTVEFIEQFFLNNNEEYTYKLFMFFLNTDLKRIGITNHSITLVKN